MAIEDYRKHAADLAGPAGELLAGVFEKYTATIMEEMHDQLRTRDAEIEKLRKTLDATMHELLDMLGTNAPNGPLNRRGD